ncbi:Uncharacterized protein Adt_02654 [Abeliophyllum distichum]|uniref:Retrotransposon gag domain-containing protein n=1 Tax=Abeliophyllum distichum TaxID=126358 RepID=A0ABD1VWG2_9LAMI
MAPRGRRVNNGEQSQQPQHNGVDPHFAQQFLAMMHTKQHPPTFEGSIDPLEAEDWLVGIERIFDLIDCPDQKKVTCATFMLKKGARRWWDSTARSKIHGHTWTWNEFKEIFLKKYFPTSIRNQKEAEFLTLTQGSISLTEYERKFEDLSHYAPTFVDTEEKKARRFEQGLRDDLRQAVVVLELGTYHEVLAKAQLADFKGRFSGEGKQQQGLVEKRKWEDNKGKEKQDYAKKGRVGPTQGGDKSYPLCNKVPETPLGNLSYGDECVFPVWENKGTWLCFARRTNNKEMHN